MHMNEKTGTGVSFEKENVKESRFNKVSCTHQPPRRGWGRDTTGIFPFALTYGMQAVIPIEIGLPTIRTATPVSRNTESIIRELDMSDE